MATRRISGAVQEGEFKEIDGSADDVTELDDSQESELRSVLNQLNADPDAQNVYVKVFKWVDGYDKPYECFKANVTEMETLSDRMRKEYGSGKYRVNVVRNGKLFKIIDYPILAPSNQEPEKVVNTGGDTGSVIKELRETIKEQANFMRDFMLQTSGRSASPSATDPVAMMTAMMTAMMQMKEFIAPPAPSNNFDNFLQLLEVAQGFNQSKGDSNFIDIIRDSVKYLGPSIGDTLQRANVATAPPLVQSQSQAQPQSQPQGENMQQSSGSIQQTYITAYVNRLVAKAKAGSEPQLQAANILDDFPDDIIEKYLLGDDTIANLAQVNPEVNNHVEWFKQLQIHLKAAYQDDSNNPA